MWAASEVGRSAITDPGTSKASGSLVALSVRVELEALQTPTKKGLLDKLRIIQIM